MPRFSAPSTTSFVASIAVIALVVVGCASTGAAAEPASPAAPTAAPAKPTVEFSLSGSFGEQSFTADPASSLDTCTHNADGSWRLLYAGGTPWVTIDMLIGAQAAEPGHANQVAVEIEVPGTYVRLDPAPIRLGDVPGRSTASVVVTPGPTSTTFTVEATTPDHTGGEDAHRSTWPSTRSARPETRG